MADTYTVYQVCPLCKGTGVINVTDTTPDPEDPEPGITTGTCPQCDGGGEVVWGRTVKD